MDFDTNRLQTQEDIRETKPKSPDEEEAEVNSNKIRADQINNTITNEMLIDMDGEDLIFSALPDFPCLSSPASASSATNHHFSTNPNTTTTTNMSTSSSSNSTSSSSWAPPVLHMQQLPTQEDNPTNDIFCDVAAELWDPSFLFPANDLCPLLQHEDQENQENDIGISKNSNQEVPRQEENDRCKEELSDDMAGIFLEWLKSNKDTLSPEDLRGIKLKKSTIECAAARLGGSKQGKTELLKLILTWVQDHHLRKKQAKGAPLPPPVPPPVLVQPPPSQENDQCYNYFPPNYPPQYPTPPPNPNPNPMMNLDYMNCDPSWMPPPLQPPPLLPPAYGNYYQGGPGIVMNGQPFSPTGDFCAPTSPLMNYGPFPGAPPVPQYGMYPTDGTGVRCCLPLRPAAAASVTREARKKRMARQKRASQHQNKSSTSGSTQLGTAMENVAVRGTGNKRSSFWSSRRKKLANGDVNSAVMIRTGSNSANMQQLQLQDWGSNSSDKRGTQRSEKNMRILLQKVLKQSDVGSLGRIVLPKKEAEIHLPELESRDGIAMLMEDIGTSQVWSMRYRFWPNNKSRMYLLENTGDFVRANDLQEGDFIVIYTDVKCTKYMIRGVKVRQPLETKGAKAGKAHQRKRRSNSKAIAASSSVDDDDYDIGELNPNSDEDEDDSVSRTMVDDAI